MSEQIQALTLNDISSHVYHSHVLSKKEPFKRQLMRWVAYPALAFLQPFIRNRIGVAIDLPCQLICIEDRFGTDASQALLLRRIQKVRIDRVLIPGCYVAGEDVQFWLRRGIKRLAGVDVYSLQQAWKDIIPRLEILFGAQVNFQQASIEALPFADSSFDLLATNAVLEHVRNLTSMVEETARVLRVGGYAWHCFGPLYYSFGADHCISEYGDIAGYDHLLLDEEEYQQRIRNQSFFDRKPDPNLPFWALQNQFSFATAADYLEQFSRRFHLELVIVKISASALAYRGNYPIKWEQLLNAGLKESDLLIKSLAVVLKKK